MDYLKIGANDSFSGFIIGRKFNNGTVLNVIPFFSANVKNTSSAMECSGIINLLGHLLVIAIAFLNRISMSSSSGTTLTVFNKTLPNMYSLAASISTYISLTIPG